MVSERHRRALEKAAQLGTLGKIDRSKQYEADPTERTGAALLRSQNYLWRKMRLLELGLKILTAAVTLGGAVLMILKQLR